MVRERIDLSGLIKLDRNYPTDNSCVRKLKDKICDMAAENMEIKRKDAKKKIAEKK